MFVDLAMLHAGRNDSHRASEYALEAATALAQVTLSSEMFGDFAAAVTFHESVSSNHARHITKLKAQREILTVVGENAHRATEGFIDTECRNATKMRDVGDGSAVLP